MIGIKSKFWRFILALLLTVLTIILFKILFDSVTIPDVSAPGTGFLRSFADAVSGVQFPEVRWPQEVPSYLKDIVSPVTVTTTLPSVTGTEVVTSPAQVQPQGGAPTQPIAQPSPKPAPTPQPAKETPLGKIFGIESKDKSEELYRKEILEEGKKRKKIGQQEYYIEQDKDGKPVLKRTEKRLGVDWLKGDSTVDPEKDPDLKKIIEPPATPTSAAGATPSGAPSPATPATGGAAPPPSKFSWWQIIGLIIILGGVGFGGRHVIKKVRARRMAEGREGLFGRAKRRWKEWKERKKPTLKIEELIGILKTISDNKATTMDEINETNRDKENILAAVDKEQKIIARVIHGNPVNLYLDPARKVTESEDEDIKKFIRTERRLVKHLYELKNYEREFLRALESCSRIIDLSAYHEQLNRLLRDRIQRIDEWKIEELRQISIIHLIYICFDALKYEYILAKDIEMLLDEENIEKLVNGKYPIELREERKLTHYRQLESKFINVLNEKIKEQLALLSDIILRLRREARLRGLITEPTAQPSPENVTTFFSGLFELLRNNDFEKVRKKLSSGESQDILNNNQYVMLEELTNIIQRCIPSGNYDPAIGLLNKSEEFFENFKPVNVIDELKRIVEDKQRFASSQIRINLINPQIKTNLLRVVLDEELLAQYIIKGLSREVLLPLKKFEQDVQARTHPGGGMREFNLMSEEIRQKAEEAKEQLKEFGRDVEAKVSEQELQQKSKVITALVRAIYEKGVKLMKIIQDSKVRAAIVSLLKRLRQKEKERLAILGEAEGIPAEEARGPPPTGAEQPTPLTTQEQNQLFNEILDRLSRLG